MTKIVIIGGGVIGSGLAWNLAKGGAADDVVVASVIIPSVGSAKSAIKRDDDNARKAQRSAFDRINLLFAT